MPLKNLFNLFKRPARVSVCLVAEPQTVTIRTDGNIVLSPDLARRLADELRAFATIAERTFSAPEEA
jgi:hypothetical protein